MSEDVEKWESVVAKLATDTRSGAVAWEIVPVMSKSSSWYRDDVVGLQYRSQISKRLVHVYEYRYRHYTDESEWDWANTIAIELVDTNGTLLWRFPNASGRYELLEAVRRATSGANALIDQYLAGKSDDDIEF